MRQLLLRIASMDACDCGQTIFWVTYLNGKRAPYTEAGLLHFVDCTGKYRREETLR